MPDGNQVDDLRFSYGLNRLAEKDTIMNKHSSLTPLPNDPMIYDDKFVLSPSRMLDLPLLQGVGREKNSKVWQDRKLKEVQTRINPDQKNSGKRRLVIITESK